MEKPNGLREFTAALAASSLTNLVCNSCPSPACTAGTSARRMLIYSDMIMLDLTGPLTVFNIMQAGVHLIAKTMQPVMTDVGPRLH